MSYCTSCGHKVGKNARFCTECGAKLRPAGEGRPVKDQERQHIREEHAPAASQLAADDDTGFSFWSLSVALFWLLYTSGMLGVVAGAYNFNPRTIDQAIDKADWITAALIVGLPFAIDLLRPVLDIVISPLEPIKQRLPTGFLIALGLSMPLVVAWMLYYVGGFREYEFARLALVFGMLATYVVLRVPRRA